MTDEHELAREIKAIKRFWSYVDQSAGLFACWPWTGDKTSSGYGRFRWRRRKWRAHRVVRIIQDGPIPDGINVCHSCDNPLCCNPAHLWLGTQRENVNDMIVKNRQAQKIGWAIADEIRSLYRTQEYTHQQLAERFGVNASHISRVICHKAWSKEKAEPESSASKPAMRGGGGPDQEGAERAEG